MQQINNFNFMDITEFNISQKNKIVILFAKFMNSASAGWNYNEHHHSYYELHINLEGTFTIYAGNETIVSNNNEYMLIYPHTPHRVKRNCDNVLRMSIAFDIQKNDSFFVKKNKCVHKEYPDCVADLIEKVVNEINQRHTGYKAVSKFYVQTILVNILREHKEILSNNELVKDDTRKNVQKAVDFIKNNISSSISGQDVSDYLNFSLRHANRIFEHNFNMSITEYIRKEKIELVKDYLENSYLSLKEIATFAGFNDEYQLCKNFKKAMGISAGEYRKQIKNIKSP